jgi:nucleotide-binding universal stress UspA family protein
MFQSILAATDRISQPDPAVISAARLARMSGTPWSIIHVLESASILDRRRVLHYRTGAEQMATPEYRTHIRRHLKTTYHDLLAWAPPCEVHVATGFPWREISRQAGRIRADLIVMGPHSGIRSKADGLRVLGGIGSTFEGVVTREHGPVMIVNQNPCRPKPSFKRILVGFDFSGSCEKALHFATALARFNRAHVDIFHMLPIPPYPKYDRENYHADIEKTRDRMVSSCASILGDLPHRFALWGGVLPDQELFKCAAKYQADAIVLGSHTKYKQGKWYAGSTVEKISQQAACPVFVLSDTPGLPLGAGRTREASGDSDGDHTIRVFSRRHADAEIH